MVIATEAGSDGSQESRTPSGSSTYIVGVQLLGPFFIAFPGTLESSRATGNGARALTG